MQLGEISFCDKIGYNLRSDEVKKKILSDLENDFQFKVIQKHFEKYNDDFHRDILKKNPYLITTRSNGNPYLLYLTKINFVNQCIFIDKKVQQGYHYPRMIVAKLWFDDALFENTLFDGEMIKDSDSKWTFVIGDVIGESGMMLQSQNLVKRINRVYDILDKQYVQDSINVCNLRVKKYFHYNEIDHVINEFIPNLNYSIRGVYFKPLFLKFKDILYNFDDSLIVRVQRFKYKDRGISGFITTKEVIDDKKNRYDSNSNTIIKQEETIESKPIDTNKTNKPNEMVFWVVKTSQADVYDLFDDTKKVGIACCNTIKTSKLLSDIFRGSTVATKFKMACKYHERFQKWEPLHQVN